MYEIIMTYLIVFTAALCVLLLIANYIIRAIREIQLSVKIYVTQKEAPQDAEKREKPPTVHLSDSELKRRRDALRGETFGP